MNIKHALFLGVAVTAGFVATVAAGRHYFPENKAVISRAQWADVYDTSDQLIGGADLVVLVEHINAKPGRVVGEGWSATPFTNNQFRVIETIKGVHRGPMLTVEQTGGLLEGGVIMNIDDGGRFEPRTQYLLFLKPTGTGMYYQINHQARYRVYADTLEGVDLKDPVVREMHWRRLTEVRPMIQEKVREQQLLQDKAREQP